MIQSSLKHIIRCHPEFFSSQVAGCGISKVGVDTNDNNDQAKFYVERVCGKKETVDLSNCYVSEEEAKKMREKMLEDLLYREEDDEDEEEINSNSNDEQKNSMQQQQRQVLRPPMVPVGMNASLFLEKSAVGTAVKITSTTNRASIVLDLIGDDDDDGLESTNKKFSPQRRGRE